MRLLFLISRPSWTATINYAEGTMGEVKKKEKDFNEFFLTLRNAIRADKESGVQHWNKRDLELHKALEETQAQVDAHLKNNFDTPAVIQSLLELVNKV